MDMTVVQSVEKSIKAAPVPAHSLSSPDPAAHAGHPSSWLPVAALSTIALLVQGGTLMSLSVFLPAIADDFGGRAGSAATAFLLAMSIVNLPVGWALDRFGARPLLATGLGLTATGCLAMAMAQDRMLLIIAMAIAGAGVGGSTIVPGIAIITRLHERRRGLALALFLGATVAAGAVVPPLIGLAIMFWHWQAAMALCGAVALACLPLILLVPGGRPGGEHAAPIPISAGAAMRHAGFRHILVATVLLQTAINGILLAAVDGLMAQGLSQPIAVGAYSIANLLGLPALLIGGLVADRLGARLALAGTALLLAMGTASLLAAQTMGMAGVAAFVLIWGLASALPGQSGSMLLADTVEPGTFPRCLGLNTAAGSLIGSLAPLWTDQMREVSGGYGLPVLVYAALALIAAPIIALVRPQSDATG